MWKEFVSRGVGSQEVLLVQWFGLELRPKAFEDERTVVAQPRATKLQCAHLWLASPPEFHQPWPLTPCSLLLSIPRNPLSYSRDFLSTDCTAVWVIGLGSPDQLCLKGQELHLDPCQYHLR